MERTLMEKIYVELEFQIIESKEKLRNLFDTMATKDKACEDISIEHLEYNALDTRIINLEGLLFEVKKQIESEVK